MHWLYNIVPRRFVNIKWYLPYQLILWALFGNDEDGIFGEEPTSGSSWLSKWDTDEPTFYRFLKWQLRNPLHNFMFRVIGIAYLAPLSRKVVYGSQVVGFFAEKGVACIIHGFLPLVSYKGLEWEMYIGWREKGNFGLACRRAE